MNGRIGAMISACVLFGFGAQVQAQCDVTEVAVEIGLTPESMAIAGLQDEAEEILLRLSGASDLCQTLAIQHAVAADAASTVTALAERLPFAPDDEDLPGQYDAAVAALDVARADITATRQALRDVTLDVETVTPEQVAALDTWRSAAVYRVPASFRVLSRTHNQWKLIEGALRAEARAIRRGEELAGEHAQLLLDIRDDPFVSDAQSMLDAYEDVVASIFELFENDGGAGSGAG